MSFWKDIFGKAQPPISNSDAGTQTNESHSNGLEIPDIDLGEQIVSLAKRGDTDGAAVLAGKLLAIGDRAEKLLASGDLDGATTLIKYQERSFHQFNNPYGLQDNLRIQVAICFKRDEFDKALELLAERERICRQFGFTEPLAQTERLMESVVQICKEKKELADLEAERFVVSKVQAGQPLTEEERKVQDRVIDKIYKMNGIERK